MLLNFKVKQIEYRIIIIFIIGFCIRLLPLFFSPLGRDAYDYIKGAESILKGKYDTDRPPIFPLLILMFLLVTQNSILAARLASFTTGNLLIITLYLVFKKASLEIFANDKNGLKKSKNIGLLISFLISIHFEFVINSGIGLYEELISILYVLFFYFLYIVKEKDSFKNYLILGLLIICLTLIHVSIGVFLFISITFFFLFSKLRYFKINLIEKIRISNKKYFFIIFVIVFSYLSWLIFCAFNFGDPFYTINRQKGWFKSNVEINLDSPQGILFAIINGLYFGLLNELVILLYSIGIIFTFSIVLMFLNHNKNEQILFILFIIIFNFLYISIFLTVPNLYKIILDIILNQNFTNYAIPSPRLIIYFFPFLIYVGSIFIVKNLYWFYENKPYISISAIKLKIKISNFLLLFLCFYTIRHLILINSIINLIYVPYDNILDYVLLFCQGLFLFPLVLLPFLWKIKNKIKNKIKKESKKDNNNN